MSSIGWNIPPGTATGTMTEASTMPSGFTDHQVYKIQCVADGTVIDLESWNTKDGARLVCWDKNDGDNQKFKALHNKVTGGFVLQCLHQGESSISRVWDHHVNEGVLGQWSRHSGSNQHFIASEIHPHSGIVRIQSMEDFTCLTHKGHGQQISLMPYKVNNPFQQWRLVMAY